jgi:fructokinase
MILCCGEALIDMLPRQTAAGEPAFAPYAGGAVFNSAIALGRLGSPTEFFSGLSRDLFGAHIQAVLAESDVGTRHAVFSDRPTTLAFVRLQDGQASYTFYDENTAGRMLSVGELPALDDSINAMLFGAISLIPEPCGSAYEALMAREHQRRVIMLDPNIRPSFISDREKHLARMRRMIAMADIVKLSDDDLEWFAETGTQAEIAARWLNSGPRLIIITGGARGVTAYGRWGAVSVPSLNVAVVDTVGAGDTFNAGVLASLHDQGLLSKRLINELSQEAVAAALVLGTRAAAVTVSRAGANPPRRHEIK